MKHVYILTLMMLAVTSAFGGSCSSTNLGSSLSNSNQIIANAAQSIVANPSDTRNFRAQQSIINSTLQDEYNLGAGCAGSNTPMPAAGCSSSVTTNSQYGYTFLSIGVSVLGPPAYNATYANPVVDPDISNATAAQNAAAYMYAEYGACTSLAPQ